MSNNTAVAEAIVSSVAPLAEELTTISGRLKRAEVETVPVAEINKAMEAAPDDENVIALKAAQEMLAKYQEAAREARKAFKTVHFPSAAADEELSADERTALIERGKELRSALVNTYAAAVSADSEFTPPEIPNVVGIRGRKPGTISGTAGKPKPRVAGITLLSEGKDGADVEIPKATFGKLQKEIKSTTSVQVDNSILTDAYLKAVGTDWDKVPTGTVTPVTLTVDKETGRTVTFNVTAL